MFMKYAVRIVEELSRTVIVEAEDWESAADKVSDKYHSCDIILEADDFSGVDFEKPEWSDDKPVNDKDTKFYEEVK